MKTNIWKEVIIVPKIKEIQVSVKTYNGMEIENIFGLGADNQIYVWNWKTGEWKINKKDSE